MLLRLTALVLILALLAFYAFVTLRSDSRLLTIPFIPSAIAKFFDLNPLSRNFPAFAVLGFLGAATVSGLSTRWQTLVLVLCLLAPVIKDVAQIFIATRHFSWLATIFGLLGALAGWAASRWLLGKIS